MYLINMRQIQCPKCLGSLEQIVYAAVEVDRCITCKGIWFDSLEVEKLKAIKGSESLDIGDPQTGSELNSCTGEVNCPICNEKMLRMVDIDRHRIWYEKCRICNGVWLDAGEFKNFKDNFKSQGLVGKFNKVLRGNRG
ncbi:MULTISPECIES: zf-TFIIB domain-containing protein [Cyanophyceae]|uniref:zf-TFIIB domain-containing protein n=1 Tax=Cyanophyceae TaxID=3028117 RepID=UPI0018EFF8C4|nr:zf-TFIIB domain-containing protein [Trichocoleus sp. FACHB-40]